MDIRTTNRTIADRLGLSVATVSRLRSGDRYPSFAVMERIASETGWSVARQSTARTAGKWYLGFEEACRKLKPRKTDDD